MIAVVGVAVDPKRLVAAFDLSTTVNSSNVAMLPETRVWREL